MRPFLSARWSYLSLFTFAVPPAVLEPRLPPGVALDTRDGQAFVSVVGLDFEETRVLGVGWPGYRAFADVNFRFYARAGERRGVVFIREIVPHRLISLLARWLYGEPFRSADVRSHVSEEGPLLLVERTFEIEGRKNVLRARAERAPFTPGPDSLEHFLKERAWGFSRSRAGHAEAFEVRHPVWECLLVRDFALELDWATVYGPEWSFLQGAAPASVALAVGSEVSVFPRAPLEG